MNSHTPLQLDSPNMSIPSFTKTYHHKPYDAISPSRPELSAKGKIVLVTGAGTGVGAACAEAFAAAGAKTIIVCGRRLGRLNAVLQKIETQFPEVNIVEYALDVSHEGQVRYVFEDVQARYGPVDIAINSAAHLSDKGTIHETSLQNFWAAFEVTCKGGFLVAQHFLRNCNSSENGGDLPVLISFNSLLGPMPATAVTTAPASYASSKVAQGKMIEYVASENQGKVRAYSVHPGIIETEMSTKSVEMTDDPAATRKGVVWDDGEYIPGTAYFSKM